MKKKNFWPNSPAFPSLPSPLHSLEGWWLAKTSYAFLTFKSISRPGKRSLSLHGASISFPEEPMERESLTQHWMLDKEVHPLMPGIKSLLGERKDRCRLCCVFSICRLCWLLVYTVTAYLWKACVDLSFAILWFLQGHGKYGNIRELWFPGSEKSWKCLKWVHFLY